MTEPKYPRVLFTDADAKIVAVSDDRVVLYWRGVAVGYFKTPMAAIRYMNAELIPI